MFSKIIKRMVASLVKSLCNYRGKPLVDAFESGIDTFHRKLNNVNFDMEINGELRVLKILSQFDQKCVFDVGVNEGEWSQLASELYPGSTIHVFEIVPSTYDILLSNIKDLQNIKANNFGLSDEAGVIGINIGKDSTMATAFKIDGMQGHDEYYSQTIDCEIKKAADYCIEENINNIDFVKIDVEGMDLRVIKGFDEHIKHVRVVQFEYGIYNISSHDLLADFCKYFKDNGFVVGKIFPKHVKFFEYHFDMENFHGSNYLAVKSDEKKLIDKLSFFGEI